MTKQQARETEATSAPQAGRPFADSDALNAALARLAEGGAPQLRALAGWLLDRPEELAFHSVRGLAARAGTNANTVIRLARALGFAGFEPCRLAAQQALRGDVMDYGARAARLSHEQRAGALEEALRNAALATARAAFAPGLMQAVRECVPLLLSARRVHCVGVRSCFALAHYFSYLGAIAHENIMPTPAQPGLIMDSLAPCDARDVVIGITFKHYSAEIVRAMAAAREQGARVIALTDSHASPIAHGASIVLRPPMPGPHTMPSQAGAFIVLETLLALLSARDPAAQQATRLFEERLLRMGAYVRSNAPQADEGQPG
ncbi:MAG: MurR/RpiR family transcriptional regulator [Pararhodobacter sp.]|nr:MurR/RpiR family transcriptional regulator [Pararhodobacter sp.]